jgi:4-hydroxy-3-methylbut-2-enyl diphosphate reductase
MSELLLIAPMGIEARALSRGAPQVQIARAGIGPRRTASVASRLAANPASAIAVAGFGGALAPGLQPGEIVVASELVGRDGTVHAQCAGAELIAGMLRRRGLAAQTGPIVSVRSPVLGRARAELREGSGALVADMESVWLARAAAGRPFVVLRVVLDGAGGGIRSLARATEALREAAAVLTEWAAAIASREVVMAAPRASCAGVERAIEVVERVLDRYGPPVYMRKQIVHNRHVVSDLERRGVVCVDELDEVPDGATVVFSAHGVSPQVREQARRKSLNVIDATCPLVAKVHGEARRFAANGYSIVLIGHDGHEEIEGTAGEAPDRIKIIASADEVDQLQIEDGHVAYLTQTTLAVDETSGVVARLRERFPEIVGPRSDDICYATQNRQDAVRALAATCDVVLVVGSRNSSNSNRLVEVAERHGCRAYLVDGEGDIDPRWLDGAASIGVTAGASSPERIVQRVVRALGVLGPLTLTERRVAAEEVAFALPREVRA